MSLLSRLLATLAILRSDHANVNVPAADALSASSPPKRVLRVCQSPGCKDDGALSTFDCLSAMAPPGVHVVKGGCVSLCGSGPVVEVCKSVDDVASVCRQTRGKPMAFARALPTDFPSPAVDPSAIPP